MLPNTISKIVGSTIKIEKNQIKKTGKFPVVSQEIGNIISGYSDEKCPISDLPIILFGDHSCTLKYIDFNFFRGADGTILLKPNNNFIPKYFFYVLNYALIKLIPNKEKYERHYKYLQNIYVPLPPLEIQQKIVSEIEVIENKEKSAKEKIEALKGEIENLFTSIFEKSREEIRLSNNDIFSINIGKRVLAGDCVPNGKIPVYSANVFEPFGNIDKLLIDDFTKPSILFGIDGDWMVNYMPENKPFYPTDHCGFIRIIDNKISPKYLAWVLNKEGNNLGFSRKLRASIDRVSAITIKNPPIAEQQKIVAKIEVIETQIAELEQSSTTYKAEKEAVLQKYL